METIGIPSKGDPKLWNLFVNTNCRKGPRTSTFSCNPKPCPRHSIAEEVRFARESVSCLREALGKVWGFGFPGLGLPFGFANVGGFKTSRL